VVSGLRHGVSPRHGSWPNHVSLLSGWRSQDDWRNQLSTGRENNCICCDFAAVQWALSTLAIASMVSPGGCHSQSFFALTLDPFPSIVGAIQVSVLPRAKFRRNLSYCRDTNLPGTIGQIFMSQPLRAEATRIPA
jgi:hypothetical protein